MDVLDEKLERTTDAFRVASHRIRQLNRLEDETLDVLDVRLRENASAQSLVFNQPRDKVVQSLTTFVELMTAISRRPRKDRFDDLILEHGRALAQSVNGYLNSVP